MYLAIIILPLLGSIVSGFFGRKVGVSGAQIITCTSVIVTTLLAIVAFFEVGLNNIPVSINLFRWIDSESLNVLWGFHFDSLTVSMLIPVLIVSSLVHIYSIGYMSHDPHNPRFFSYLSLFTFMMIILVTANNFLLMFVGWEGVGICSYLLVSFWFTRIAANQSSISAFLTNRVGDCFLTIGMFAILWSFGNIDYSTVFSLAPFVNENIVTIIGICLLIGAMAKSSQVGLHVWLPMAMEGPTPVSALIHAATMVTAGVYLLMRTSPLIEYSSTVLILCLWLGAITTVFSSLIGLFQQDIKKVIAYSTMSQLAQEYIIFNIFRHQTICVEVLKFLDNSQITKAHEYIYTRIKNNYFNSFPLQGLVYCILNYIVFVKWVVIFLSKLVGISEAIRLILILKLFNSLIFKFLNSLSKLFFSIIFILIITYNFLKTITLSFYNKVIGFINIHTHTKQTVKHIIKNETENFCRSDTDTKEKKYFYEWLGGLIDGDGHFILTKKGYASCVINMDISDYKVLNLIKQNFGGTIKPISNSNALRYKLRHRKGLKKLINALNGLIRNPTKMLQMNKLCLKFGIEFKYPTNLTYYNGWLSGFIDSDGSVYYNEEKKQVFIGITQKNRFLLEPLIKIYGGKVDMLSPKTDAFKYYVYKKEELNELVDNYFKEYPLKTKKCNRINLIKQFYPLWKEEKEEEPNDSNYISILKKRIIFKDNWEKYKN